MVHATYPPQTSSEQILRSQVTAIEGLGGENLTGSGFEAEDPELEFEEGV